MSKTFNSFEKATIKTAAKAVAHYQAKKDKIVDQIVALQAQMEQLNEEIKVYEDSVMNITGGFRPLQLCEKVSRGSGAQSDWVFKYPNTIIPQYEEEELLPNVPLLPGIPDNGPYSEEENQEYEEVMQSQIEKEAEKEKERDPMDDIF